MKTQPIKQAYRLGVVDALRGFALLAIVLLHNLEHYNLFFQPLWQPDWLNALDRKVWDLIFFLFAGKAYATFSLLFGFSFYIQYVNAEKRGGDFRGRFAWRLFLLFLFSQLHALFYNGDILLLYSVVGLILIPTCRLKDRTVLVLALILLLQPLEWIRILIGCFNPDLTLYGKYFWIFAQKASEPMRAGTFPQLLLSNITDGQLYSNLWQIENGRLFQTASLFLFGMLLGRRKLFQHSAVSKSFWKKVLLISPLCFVPLYLMRIYLPGIITAEAISMPVNILLPSLSNFAFMCILVSVFVLLWFKKEGYAWQSFIIPYGKMTLTNYIGQSVLGIVLYYGFGFGLYQYAGMTLSLTCGILIFLIQFLFSKWWLTAHVQGPLEYAWKKATWISFYSIRSRVSTLN